MFILIDIVICDLYYGYSMFSGGVGGGFQNTTMLIEEQHSVFFFCDITNLSSLTDFFLFCLFDWL